MADGGNNTISSHKIALKILHFDLVMQWQQNAIWTSMRAPLSFN
jgi:hypothetical protein